MKESYVKKPVIHRDFSNNLWYLKGSVKFRFYNPFQKSSKNILLEDILSRAPKGRNLIKAGFLYDYLSKEGIYQGNNLFIINGNESKLGGKFSVIFPLLRIPEVKFKIEPVTVNTGNHFKNPSLDNLLNFEKFYVAISQEIEKKYREKKNKF